MTVAVETHNALAPLERDPFVDQVAARLREIGPGGKDEAAFREVVPVTPLVVVDPKALPEDIRNLPYLPSVALKCDQQMPGGAYKLRGAVSNLLQVPKEQRGSITVVAASTGNHGNETAIASDLLGFAGTEIYASKNIVPTKALNMQRNGATIHAKPTLEVSLKAAEAHGRRPDARYVPPYNDGDVIAGQGTAAEEVAWQLAELGLSPDDSSVFCTGGGCGNVAGQAVGAAMYMPGASVHVVQAKGAHAAVAEITGQKFNPQEFDDACDGAAVLKPGELPMKVLKTPGLISGAHAVTMAEIGEAIAILSPIIGTVEPAGATAFAGLLKELRAGNYGSGPMVAHISGANTTPEKVHEFMTYAFQAGLVDGRTATNTIGRAHTERSVHGMDEILARGLGSSATGLQVWHGATSRE